MNLETQPLFESAIPRNERLFRAQKKLSETMDALITFDGHKQSEESSWIAELRGALVDNIMLAVHDYATSKGIEENDEQTRLDVARHFDAHLRNGHNPLRDLETIYDPLTNPPEVLFPVSEEQKRDFNSFQTLTLQYAASAQTGYEDLANL
jgi:hypothetical protein